MNAVIPDFKFSPNHEAVNLRGHDVILRGNRVTLRPMTEDDWDILLEWNNDPEVMEYTDARDFKESTLNDIQSIYRWISTHAYCFVIEVGSQPIGALITWP